MNNEQMELQIKVWTDLFSEYSVEAVMSGVRTFATTDASGFPPVPGQIIENMYRVAHLTDDSAIKAWNLVRRAINMPRDQYGLAYDALPEDVRETLGTKENAIATLTSWGMVPTEQFETVVQSNFLRSYESVKRGRTKEKYMPKKVLVGRGSVYKELSQKITPNVEIGTIEIDTGTEELVKKLAAPFKTRNRDGKVFFVERRKQGKDGQTICASQWDNRINKNVQHSLHFGLKVLCYYYVLYQVHI